MVKNLPAVQETWVRSLGLEDPLKKEMATHSNILSCESYGWRNLAGYSPWGLKESDTTERLSTRTCEGRGEESGCSRVKWNIITGTLVHLLLITTDRPRSWCGTCLKTAHTSSLEQPMFHARIMSCVRESGLFFKTSLLPKWHITTNV